MYLDREPGVLGKVFRDTHRFFLQKVLCVCVAKGSSLHFNFDLQKYLSQATLDFARADEAEANDDNNKHRKNRQHCFH